MGKWWQRLLHRIANVQILVWLYWHGGSLATDLNVTESYLDNIQRTSSVSIVLKIL
jgi:hypothetical protein